jgi:hypothetical protein
MKDGNSVFTVIFNKIFGTSKSAFTSNKKNEIVLKKVEMHILEMEDVLFHLNSCVMMPENPQGSSSSDGTSNDSSSDSKVSGIKALSLVFKFFESEPDKRMIITGHTDTSGTAAFNFKLSDERAKNILYLLNGNKSEWAALCYNRHKIEDYQQILKYFKKKLTSNCDPGDIDDKWGDNTRSATKNFFSEVLPAKSVALLGKVENDQKKRWPVEAWEAVYNLYNKEIAEILEISESELNLQKKTDIKYVDEKKQVLGCGESFPIENKEKDNYRSQKNRRVEIIFFDKDETPVINCPARVESVHTEKECPLYKKFYFVPIYIEPKEVKSVVYHLQFVYFNKVLKKQLSVPEGLVISVYEDSNKKLDSETTYKEGVYSVKVNFKNQINNPNRTKLYFEFETTDSWIHTQSEKDNPIIIKKNTDEIKSLEFLKRQQYYDLPGKWSSQNYWTRYDGDINKGDRFEKVFKDVQKLKPFGDSITKPDKPLVFSLDDIVLTNQVRNQNIKDKNSTNGDIDLDDKSRITVFYIDHETKENVDGNQKNLRRLKIFKPDENEPVFSNIPFTQNLIHDLPGFTRIIYFCNGFYDVGSKRSSTTDNGFNYTNSHIEGARLAVLNDTDLQVTKLVSASVASDLSKAYALSNCGNYELHYFHDCTELDGKAINYLIVYWSCRFTLLPSPGGGTQADITNHRKFGMVNAMARLNKNYVVEKYSGSEDFMIRLFHFMEAKNDTNGGIHKALTDIVGNSHGAWMLPATAQFRKRDYQDDPNYFGAADPINNMQDTDGSTFAVLTNAHEMGHATGNWDHYLYDYQSGGTNWDGLPRYDQPYTAVGGPYRCDELSRMYHNRTPRLRSYWKFVLWLNDESPAGKTLNKFLNGTIFKITFKGLNHKHEFFLADSYRNVELASKSQLDHVITANSKIDLLLYKLGDDESSRLIHSGQVFNGILVVKIRLAIKFIDTATENWGNSKLAWAQQLKADFENMLNKKFRIATDANNDFKNVFMIFTPSFRVYTGTAPADSQINIETTFGLGNSFTPNNKTLAVDWDTDTKRIIRYCFGKTTGTADLINTDFPTIVTWMNSPSVANASYTIHNL